jgi:hypothetical protein
MLTSIERSKVVKCCINDIVPDPHFDASVMFPSDWFVHQFDFLKNTTLAEHLGDAFFQARFVYKLMSNLQLKKAKNKGIIKFQIIQYASICEALLNYTIEKFLKEDFINNHMQYKYVEIDGALSRNTRILYDGNELKLCKIKKEKVSIEWCFNPPKAEYAFNVGILCEDTKNAYCKLYDLRNNAHILKAAQANYFPTVMESKEAFKLTIEFINEIKKFFLSRE